jgi:hypothetical protein
MHAPYHALGVRHAAIRRLIAVNPQSAVVQIHPCGANTPIQRADAAREAAARSDAPSVAFQYWIRRIAVGRPRADEAGRNSINRTWLYGQEQRVLLTPDNLH